MAKPIALTGTIGCILLVSCQASYLMRTEKKGLNTAADCPQGQCETCDQCIQAMIMQNETNGNDVDFDNGCLLSEVMFAACNVNALKQCVQRVACASQCMCNSYHQSETCEGVAADVLASVPCQFEFNVGSGKIRAKEMQAQRDSGFTPPSEGGDDGDESDRGGKGGRTVAGRGRSLAESQVEMDSHGILANRQMGQEGHKMDLDASLTGKCNNR